MTATSSPLLLLPSLQTCYTNSRADERRELVEEEEDHTYELLLTAQTKVPASTPDSHSSKSMCVQSFRFHPLSRCDFCQMAEEFGSLMHLKM